MEKTDSLVWFGVEISNVDFHVGTDNVAMAELAVGRFLGDSYYYAGGYLGISPNAEQVVEPLDEDLQLHYKRIQACLPVYKNLGIILVKRVRADQRIPGMEYEGFPEISKFAPTPKPPSPVRRGVPIIKLRTKAA